MSGLPLVGEEDLDADQEALWEYILEGPRGCFQSHATRTGSRAPEPSPAMSPAYHQPGGDQEGGNLMLAVIFRESGGRDVPRKCRLLSPTPGLG